MLNQNYNKDVLTQDLSFVQFKNTILYQSKNKNLVFSPVVSRCNQGLYWFDISLANLRRKQEFSPVNTILLVRVKSDKFVLMKFDEMQAMINGIIPSRNVWGFRIDFVNSIIVSRNKSEIFRKCLVMDRDGVVLAFQQMLK